MPFTFVALKNPCFFLILGKTTIMGQVTTSKYVRHVHSWTPGWAHLQNKIKVVSGKTIFTFGDCGTNAQPTNVFNVGMGTLAELHSVKIDESYFYFSWLSLLRIRIASGVS